MVGTKEIRRMYQIGRVMTRRECIWNQTRTESSLVWKLGSQTCRATPYTTKKLYRSSGTAAKEAERVLKIIYGQSGNRSTQRRRSELLGC